MIVTLLGLFVKPLSYLVPVKHKSWIFGADCGNMYREGSKYMLEYMLANHPDFDCTFITRNPQVKKELDQKGIPSELNFSLRGIWKVLRSEYVFTTQVATDILLVYKKKKRTFIYLCHGQPYKAVFLATPKDYSEKTKKNYNPLVAMWKKFAWSMTLGYNYVDSKFFISTSEYLVKYNKMYFGDNSDIRILGMPRNDGLFDDKRMKSERWLNKLENKFVVTYMPTHRDYGRGKTSPVPFLYNEGAQQWMRENNVVLVVKQHPNMEYKTNVANNSDVLIDVTKMKLDPQVVLYHSDVLITDFSSVWIDYLILQRPLLFYIYDNYEVEDTGKLYDIRKDPPGHFCYNEYELLRMIERTRNTYEEMKPPLHILKKYHKYLDGYSCERLFLSIMEDENA